MRMIWRHALSWAGQSHEDQHYRISDTNEDKHEATAHQPPVPSINRWLAGCTDFSRSRTLGESRRPLSYTTNAGWG